MEKNWILEPPYKTMRALYLIVSLFLLYGCAMPEIIVLKDPLSPEEHLNLGVSYEKNGELDLAIKEYKLALKKLPQAYLYLGNAYFLKNEFTEAERYYKKAIEKDPTGDAFNNLAWLYYIRRENLNEAEALVLKAIELEPLKESIYRDTLQKIREVKCVPPK
ncbi:MAG: tetratricopeptide repeat protein [Nitrospirae bacterium]|nr:tetratricopeptide repeat protein [Nitrospirota bacterium]